MRGMNGLAGHAKAQLVSVASPFLFPLSTFLTNARRLALTEAACQIPSLPLAIAIVRERALVAHAVSHSQTALTRPSLDSRNIVLHHPLVDVPTYRPAPRVALSL